MKKGDTLPVKVEGITVAQALVEAVEADRVTLLIPGTRAVVGIRVSLSDDQPEASKETVIDGVDRPVVEAPVTEATAPVVAPVEAPVETAPVETPAEPVVEAPSAD